MTSLSGITIACTKDKEGRIIRRYFKEQYPDYYVNILGTGGGRFFQLGTNESLPTPDNIIPSESRPEEIIDGRKFEVIDTQCECELSIPYEITGDLLIQHSIIEVRPPVFLDIYDPHRATGFTGTIVVPSSMYNKYVSSNSYSSISGRVHTFDDAVYQWNKAPVTDYACVGVDKHYKEYYQVSYDSTTWYNVTPLSSRTSEDVIEYNSMACGYIPPLKYLATYSDSHIESAYCGSSSVLSRDEITRSNLVSAEIGNCVTEIGSYVFNGCSILTSVTIPNSVTSIGGSAFYGCRSLTGITIPDSVTSIGGSAFSGCSSFTSVIISSGVTYIRNYTFSNCTSITSVTIPNSVTSIGQSAFSSCSGLTSIGSVGSGASVEIPSGVTSIGESAFYGCSGLTSCTIGSGVTSIGGSAFSNCSGLTNVILGSRSIGTYACSNCRSLTNITFGSGVRSIGERICQGCSGLTSVTVEATTPPTLGSMAFYGADNFQIFVPAESVDAYKYQWSAYSDRIQALT